ncbi:hypothetical protein FH5_04290 [Priestia endophytica]|nr:hypothetical protein FH5_04290 [Priestia endophytica]
MLGFIYMKKKSENFFHHFRFHSGNEYRERINSSFFDYQKVDDF